MKTPAREKRKKNPEKLIGRFNIDHMLSLQALTAKTKNKLNMDIINPSLKRMEALVHRDKMKMPTPFAGGISSWVPLGPLSVPNGQTYGGARVLISGRIPAIAPHPADPDTIYIGTARGGVWKSTDAGANWLPLTDNADSLAIGALAVAKSNPNVIYAGTGEGNQQAYSTFYSFYSAPGVYLGVGILKSIDGGNSWATTGAALFSNHSFYRIAVDPNNDQRAFAAASKGLCRTTDGTNWTNITGGLPAISASVIACTDVLIDLNDVTGNTVYAAFWGSGIYRSTNALSPSPSWTKLTTGLPSFGISRISLAQSTSMPSKLFAMISSPVTGTDDLKGVYQTTSATGNSWDLIISSDMIRGLNSDKVLYGAYTSNIAVDPTTPDVLYISGVELIKCVFSGGTWTACNIGGNIHADSHSFAFHPTNASIIYSGNDGGIYKSTDGGVTWDDSFNEGINILQYEAMDQHPVSDAFVIGGTQDNGTEIFRNSPVFYHAADGDGGYCNISPVTPVNVVHSYYNNSFERSTKGGKFDTWSDVSVHDNSGIFYPPAAISPSSMRMAVGTTFLNIDDAQGTGGWPVQITLPGTGSEDRVTAVSFATDTILYAGTSNGEVFRAELSGGTWTERKISTSPLPTSNWIWDIAAVPGNPNAVIAVFSGFGIKHVWKGTVPATGVATWTDISGSGTTPLPDIPMYAIAFKTATEFFVGTDVGVFITKNGGSSWSNFNQGMPNTAVYDMRYHEPTNLLRAATHGRGLWEISVDPVAPTDSDLFFRDNVMHTGRFTTLPLIAAWDDPLDHVTLGDVVRHWQCADIKVDAPPSFQLTLQATYLDFETKLEHRNPEKGNMNRVYVQVHNRGPLPASNVWVTLMFANASAGLPNLPQAFWATFPNFTGNADWIPVGSPKQIAVLNPLKPEVLEWDWTPPANANTHTCLLAIMDSASNPIPASAKIANVDALVCNEKRAGLKNLHVVDLLPNVPAIIDFYFYGLPEEAIKIKLFKQPIPKDLNIDLILLKKTWKSIDLNKIKMAGFKETKLNTDDGKRIVSYFGENEQRNQNYIEVLQKDFNFSSCIRADASSKPNEVSGIILPKEGMRVLIVISSSISLKQKKTFSIVQTTNKGIITSGSTFVVKPYKIR